jgi:hypothetical protein
VAAFALVAGIRVLDPANIAWLGQGDAATNYLGWHFFRTAPWASPPGANPSYGLELGSSVVFSDSIPGLALFFKLFSPVLPATFQYFGVWLLACFALQAFLGWKLAALASERASIRLLGAGLMLFAPPFLWRVGVHASLAAHWLILAALYLNLCPRPSARVFWWGLLVCAAVLVHAYLWAMVLALWLADFIARARARRPLAEPLLAVGVSLLTMWLCGYFMLRAEPPLDVPYGVYRMNLLSPLDPSGWSHVLPDIAEGPNDYEGFNFLGLGALALLAVVLGTAALAGLRRALPAAIPRQRRPLLAVLALLTLFALSHKIVAAAAGPLIIPLPGLLEEAFSAFRTSARFFWPVFYALLWLILWLAARVFSHRAALALLSLALGVQIADTSAGWSQRRIDMSPHGPEWQTTLRSPFWQAAAPKYRKLRWVPAASHPMRWPDLAYYAARHGMATDAVYLARIDPASRAASRRATVEAVRSRRFDRDTLYVVDRQFAALWNLQGVVVDGLIVIAPGADPFQ